ncbi:MAG: nucleoside-diphosphate sugar epimerase/dehydratase [Hespellia sp.]|nr:nucleoside-diphosphate sugar epimerase/dehydratase [Hespellia sp.]
MNKRRIQLVLIDTIVIIAVYYLETFFLQNPIESIEVNGDFTISKLLTLCLCLMISRCILKIYNNIWRYVNVSTYLKLVAADAIGGVCFIILGRVIEYVNLGVACSVLTIMGVAICTLCSRFIYQLSYARREIRGDNDYNHEIHKIDIAIVGAGNVGATLAEELTRNPKSHYKPYCFIDKDTEKIGNGINGLPIFPENENIIGRIKKLPIQEIVIALPDASAEDKARLYDFYKQTDCKVKIYDYPLGESGKGIDGSAEKRMLREFKIEDLLFRESLAVNSSKTRSFYKNKTILVTGGGGSIGSELCRQIAGLQPKKLVIVDIYENNAYDIQQELIRRYGSKLHLEVFIASVRDVKRLNEIFKQIQPDIVFHAAAHKHVPLMEGSGCEAIKNNVMGTYNVANMSEKYGVDKFLLISTDKAVNPTNIMGASKRLCEMVIQCRTDSKTEFTAVRFGNVLGSNGSVIPLFKRQIEAGGPLTLTDKRIIRYFMTIPEAVGLVMETGAMAKNGELFVLDMGKPVKILDLAENMIRLSGLRPYADIDIVEIGLRPGEKLYEELLMKAEEMEKTDNEMIFIERSKGLSREEVEQKIQLLLKAVEKEGYSNVIEAIKATVPTYHNPDEVNEKAALSDEMKNVKQKAELVTA